MRQAEAALSNEQRFRIAKARAQRLLARAWDESKHPREPAGSPDGGQFAGGDGEESRPKGGGTSGSGISRTKAEKIAFDVAASEGFDEKKFKFSTKNRHSNIGTVMAAANMNDGTIEIYHRAIKSEKDLPGVVAHEIEHHKFNTAFKAYEYDQRQMQMMWEENNTDEEGNPTPEAAAKYPNYADMHKAFFSKSISDFAKTDGVSDYSLYYWQVAAMAEHFKFETVKVKTAIHETLAEMARIKKETGQLPKKHMGEGNTTHWRDLFDAVDRIYRRKQK